ncbi:MAG TPA: hypothetical protein VMS00_05565 [Acidimicrobiales bacterium]|nr:hypothetical protein [Acidimicrobiales bacterium]
MAHTATAPRRTRTVDALLWQLRAMAVLALIVLVAGVVSDLVAGDFWVRHALLASVTGSVIVVLLSIAVINEMLERRRRRRWSVLAQYVMFELVRNARMVWSGVLELAGLASSKGSQRESIDAGRQVVRDTSRLKAAVREIINDDERSASLRSEVALLADHADEVLGRWAAVMLASEVYAEVIDRHVELAGDVTWIASVFDAAYPPSDPLRQRRARSSPAVEINSDLGGEWLADRIVVITQLAEELDRSTLEIALRIVPVQWWEERLGTNVPSSPPT